MTEYRKKVITCHPDKTHHDDLDSKRRFELLQLAKETLTDESLRIKYNKWLKSGLCMSWKDWLSYSQKHQMVCNNCLLKNKEYFYNFIKGFPLDI